MAQPQPVPPPAPSKKVFAGLGIGALVVIILIVAILGGIGGTVVYQAAQLPSIHVTDINAPQGTPNPRSSTVVNDGLVTNSGSFDYTPTLQGTYVLVFDNSFSVVTAKTVSVSYTVAGTSDTRIFTVNAGHFQGVSITLLVGERIYGTFTISGGNNDVDFYITAQTCTQAVDFSFTLVNSGSANGYVTVQFTVDGASYWNNHYYVAQGQQLPESGSIVLGDCSSHNYGVVVSQTQKA